MKNGGMNEAIMAFCVFTLAVFYILIRSNSFLCLADILPLGLLLPLLTDLLKVYPVALPVLRAFSQAHLYPERHPFSLPFLPFPSHTLPDGPASLSSIPEMTPKTLLILQALCCPIWNKHAVSRTSLSSHFTEYSFLSPWSIHYVILCVCVCMLFVLFFKL